NLLDRGRLTLMWADADPGDSPITVGNKCRTPREIDRIDSGCLIDPVRARYGPCFVEKNRKRIGVLLDVFLPPQESVDFLRRNKHDPRVTFDEFVMSRLELSQLVRAVRSPRAAYENQHQRPPAIIGKPHRLAIRRRQVEIRSRIAVSKRS